MDYEDTEAKRTKSHRIVRHLLKLWQGFHEGGVPFSAFLDGGDADQRVVLRDLAELKTIADEFGWEFTTPGPGKVAKGKDKRYFLHLPMLPETDDKNMLLNLLMLERLEKKPWGKFSKEEEDHYRALYQLVRYKYMTHYLKKMRNRVVFLEPEINDSGEIEKNLSVCLEALGTERVVQMVYNAKLRRVWPLGLACRDDKWYLFGHCEETREQSLFRVDKLRQAEVTPERFQYPADFSMRKAVNDIWDGDWRKRSAPVRVVIEAAGEASQTLLDTKFHPSQQIENQSGDSLRVSFELEDWTIMVNWVLRWGELVEVVEPDELRKEIGKILRNLADRYQVT